jgi:ABC-type branched-subunit amino acid transport system permease subunit
MDSSRASFGGAISTGVALAITVGIGYTACALAFRAAPDAAMTFMNALFHGLDFRKLQGGPALFDFGSFFFALFVAVVWAFVLGAVFGWIVDRLRRAA